MSSKTKPESTETLPDRETKGKDTCRRGHPKTPENTYVNPQGGRTCRICLKKRLEKRKTK